MQIVVIGGTGLIGTKLVDRLRRSGREVVAAAPATGVNTVTGEGLAGALAGAQVVVDVANAPKWEDKAVMEFFETSTRKLLAAEVTAGVRHHVALSVVGTERLLGSGYFRAKIAQEKLVADSEVPFTIVRSTQFFEFLAGIAQSGTDGQTVRIPSVAFQPIAADDVAAALADFAVGAPVNGMVEIAGPERKSMADFVERFLSAKHDAREVVADPHARYFGLELDDRSLVPEAGARLGAITLEEWLHQAIGERPAAPAPL